MLDELNHLGRMSECALDLFVTSVTDQHDRVPPALESTGTCVNLRDQWTRRIDDAQVEVCCLLTYLR
ncbi:hypothetical protein D806_040030 [Mycolicibacterium smegmatis MKD8]|uniref:Uncharacterized protein n=1 Tax=Mycolicibacterium smegmatis (strain MKD8) TaxID=1214915 RepID=A0A2U9PT46_MYCSE|nr:hypothetical protein D806_040030 [Mycolicibacterium smegmatis MKD8]